MRCEAIRDLGEDGWWSGRPSLTGRVYGSGHSRRGTFFREFGWRGQWGQENGRVCISDGRIMCLCACGEKQGPQDMEETC